MTERKIGTREEWLAACNELLERLAAMTASAALRRAPLAARPDSGQLGRLLLALAAASWALTGGSSPR